MRDNSIHDKIARMFSGCLEVIGVNHVEAVLSGKASHSGDNQLVAYIGLEPSGKAHLGWLLLSGTIRKMLDEGVNADNPPGRLACMGE